MRLNNCRGIRVLRIGRYQLELWWCPAGEAIPWHSHNHCDSRIVHLFGRMLWMMPGKRRVITRFGWSRNVPIGTPHAAMALRATLFLNFERWYTKPTSAVEDFQLI